MIELLTVISILMLLAAIISPTLLLAKQNAKQTASKLKLKQAQQAVAIYMVDYSDLPTYARPDSQVYITTFFGIGPEAFRSPCGVKNFADGSSDFIVSYLYIWGGNPESAEEIQHYEEKSLLFVDVDCNPNAEIRRQAYTEKLAIAVTMGGNIMQKNGYGYPWQHKFWYKN
jgi:hypothetical protein